MLFTKTPFPNLLIKTPKVFTDSRGYFFESYNQKQFEEKVGKTVFVQDNESKSTRGVLRGLHFQTPPFAQAKLVRCIQGRILDVVVDLRKGSPTFCKHLKIELSGENKKQIFISQGFAHGYVVLSETAIIAYKVDKYYSPEHETGIIYNDTDLNIKWEIPYQEIILSDKDRKLKFLKEITTPFTF